MAALTVTTPGLRFATSLMRLISFWLFSFIHFAVFSASSTFAAWIDLLVCKLFRTTALPTWWLTRLSILHDNFVSRFCRYFLMCSENPARSLSERVKLFGWSLPAIWLKEAVEEKRVAYAVG